MLSLGDWFSGRGWWSEVNGKVEGEVRSRRLAWFCVWAQVRWRSSLGGVQFPSQLQARVWPWVSVSSSSHSAFGVIIGQPQGRESRSRSPGIGLEMSLSEEGPRQVEGSDVDSSWGSLSGFRSGLTGQGQDSRWSEAKARGRVDNLNSVQGSVSPLNLGFFRRRIGLGICLVVIKYP